MWIDDGDYKRLLIICAGSRQGQLIIFWVDDPDNDWSRTSKIMKTIIGKETVHKIFHLIKNFLSRFYLDAE